MYLLWSDWKCFVYPVGLGNLKGLLRRQQWLALGNDPAGRVHFSTWSWRLFEGSNGCSHWDYCMWRQWNEEKEQNLWDTTNNLIISRVGLFPECFILSLPDVWFLHQPVFGWAWPQPVPREMPLLCSASNSSGCAKESKQRNSVGGTWKQLLVPGEPESAAVNRSEPHTHTHLPRAVCLRPSGFEFWVVPELSPRVKTGRITWQSHGLEKSEVLVEGTLGWSEHLLRDLCGNGAIAFHRNIWPIPRIFFTAPASVAISKLFLLLVTLRRAGCFSLNDRPGKTKLLQEGGGWFFQIVTHTISRK